MAGKRQPERTCVGCRSKAEKRALIRVVRSPDRRVALDPTGRAAGRGAYVHPSRECLRLALRRGAIARALQAPLGQAEAARLIEELGREVGDEA
ncbi:MAG TPA: YlxR family protein [Actinomycetota bacterium]|jgi:hypothetical protein